MPQERCRNPFIAPSGDVVLDMYCQLQLDHEGDHAFSSDRVEASWGEPIAHDMGPADRLAGHGTNGADQRATGERMATVHELRPL